MDGGPVLSMYVDLDPTRFPTPDTLASELGSLLDDARRRALKPDVRLIADWIEGTPEAHVGVHGLALFASARTGLFEQVRLPSPVEPMVVVDTIPWLEPLAARITPGSWAVAVVDRRSARLFRGGPAGISEFASFTDEVYRRHAQGGWSQARYQRGIEEQVAAHARGVVERLLRAHERQRFGHLVIICSDELRPVIAHAMPGELRSVVTDFVDADLEKASVAEVAAAVTPHVERAERRRELQLIERLDQALGTGGAGAAGLDDVLSALEQGVVAVLLVPEQDGLDGWLCRVCGRLSADGSGRCPLDGSELDRVDAVEHAVRRASAHAAEVVVVRWEQEWLRQHGNIAALLRW